MYMCTHLVAGQAFVPTISHQCTNLVFSPVAEVTSVDDARAARDYHNMSEQGHLSFNEGDYVKVSSVLRQSFSCFVTHAGLAFCACVARKKMYQVEPGVSTQVHGNGIVIGNGVQYAT